MMIPKPVYYLSTMGLLPVIAGAIGSLDFVFLGEEINNGLHKFGLIFSALIPVSYTHLTLPTILRV